MTVTAASFRTAFPEFSDTSVYPDPEVNFWLTLSPNLLDANRWGALFDFGQQLFMAHNLSISFNSKAAAAAGGNPGAIVGTVTSGSVDKVSYSRDASSAMDPKNGHWNLSSYGLRYIQLARTIGAGPIQIGVPSPADAVSGAWPGVIY